MFARQTKIERVIESKAVSEHNAVQGSTVIYTEWDEYITCIFYESVNNFL